MPHCQPTQDRLLVLRDPAPTINPNPPYLLLPESQREKNRPHTGTVAAVGPGRRYDDGVIYPLAVQKGQRVMFAHADTLTKVDHDGQEHLMMREQDVFLVLKEWSAAEWVAERNRQGAKTAIISHKLFDRDFNAVAALGLPGIKWDIDSASGTTEFSWQ